MQPALLGRARRAFGGQARALQARVEGPLVNRLAQLRTAVAELHVDLNAMRSELTAVRSELADARRAVAEVEGRQQSLDAPLVEQVAALRDSLVELREHQTRQLRLSRAAYDDLPALRQKLLALRRSDGYAATFDDRNPLVSVPIATYNASELLVERAIASVLAQTYTRWEVVVVGDGCTDDTAERVAALGDDRIRFVNLPFRTVYPDSPTDRWLVSGAAPWNHAVELCRGEWIAALDDDDEFLPHHMETLLALALEQRAEYAYGAFEHVAPDETTVAFAFPPAAGGIAMQASIYLRALDFFECDVRSWAMDEGTDWNLMRRMRDAGVIMVATERPVARYYPSFGTWR